MKEYRIQPVQSLVHGLKEEGFMGEPEGFELFVRKDIKLVSLGIYPDEDTAKAQARKHAKGDSVKFV